MKRNVKTYNQFLNESEQKVVYPTNFGGMVQGAISSIHSQIMAIARQMAEEKLARNPSRYTDTEKIGGVEEVDIARAINLIFHSDWKTMMKEHNIKEWARLSLERAGKHDDRSDKKNQSALRANGQQNVKDEFKVELDQQGFSRDSGSEGAGSNQ